MVKETPSLMPDQKEKLEVVKEKVARIFGKSDPAEILAADEDATPAIIDLIVRLRYVVLSN